MYLQQRMPDRYCVSFGDSMIISDFVFNISIDNNVKSSLYKIKGVVSKQSVPVPCVVRLYEKGSGQLVQQKLSKKDGSYEFGSLNNTFKFFIVAHDPASQFNAVIQDNVVPK